MCFVCGPAGKSFSINCPASSGPVPCSGAGVEVRNGECVPKDSQFASKVDLLLQNGKIAKVETSQAEVQTQLAKTVKEIKLAAAQSVKDAETAVQSGVGHLKALDAETVLRLTCVGMCHTIAMPGTRTRH